MKRLFVSFFASALFMAVGVLPAFAHVVVQPSSAGEASFQTFTMGVPSEKDLATTSVRLVMPDGLNFVTPIVKPGWEINVKKDGDGEDAKVNEITWTGGSIPAFQKDLFLFSAQVPKSETTLKWKAYQTYSDGSIVSWDQEPNGSDDESSTPYSKTMVVNDLNDLNNTQLTDRTSRINTKANIALVLGSFGIFTGLSALAILYIRREKK